MADLDTIEQTEKSTAWVNSLAIVEKANGKLRMSLNPDL